MACPWQPTEGLVKGEHDEPVLGHRPWGGPFQEEGKKGCQSLLRGKDAGQEQTHTTPQCRPDLRVVGWPASECPSKSSPTPGSLS